MHIRKDIRHFFNIKFFNPLRLPENYQGSQIFYQGCQKIIKVARFVILTEICYSTFKPIIIFRLRGRKTENDTLVTSVFFNILFDINYSRGEYIFDLEQIIDNISVKYNHLIEYKLKQQYLESGVCPEGHRMPDLNFLVYHISCNASLVEVTGLVDAQSEQLVISQPCQLSSVKSA